MMHGLAAAPWVWAVALVVLLIGCGAVIALYLIRGRDRRFANQIPGLLPELGEDAREIDQARVRSSDIAVSFTPPDLSPGLAHVLAAEWCDVQDYIGTVLFLADQGYLTLHASPLAGGPWSAAYARDPAGLTMFDRSVVELAVKDPMLANPADLPTLRQAAYYDLKGRGLIPTTPFVARLYAGASALGVLIVGVVLTISLWQLGAGAVGLGMLLAGVLLAVLGRRMPARTAAGRAALIQTLNFLLYLRTAEARQLAEDIGTGRRTPLVPWGVAFGLGRLPGGLAPHRARQVTGLARLLAGAPR